MPVGRVRWGALARSTPLSRVWGIDRGGAIDRYFIESFLTREAAAIRGRVLEIANDAYTRRFGSGVEQSDVLNVVAGDPRTTFVADLADGSGIPSGIFDCVICNQTLQLIFDVRPALRTLHRILRPGGVLLLTVPGISQISRFDADRWGDYWRFSARSIELLLGEVFEPSGVEIRSFGNALAVTAFLYGLSPNELRAEDLEHQDPQYEMLLAARAERSAG